MSLDAEAVALLRDLRNAVCNEHTRGRRDFTRGRRTIIRLDEAGNNFARVLEYVEAGGGMHTFYLSARYSTPLLAVETQATLRVRGQYGVGAVSDTIEFDLRSGAVFSLPAENVYLDARFELETDTIEQVEIFAYGVPGAAPRPGFLTFSTQQFTIAAGGGTQVIPIPQFATAYRSYMDLANQYVGNFNIAQRSGLEGGGLMLQTFSGINPVADGLGGVAVDGWTTLHNQCRSLLATNNDGADARNVVVIFKLAI